MLRLLGRNQVRMDTSDLVLVTLEIFDQHDRKEISLGELDESIRLAQEQRSFRCTFSDVVLYQRFPRPLGS